MAFNDKATASDHVSVELGKEVAPRFPCPKCGKETLEHRGPPGTRICCMPGCRHVVHQEK